MIPNYFQRGAPIAADKLNALVDYVRQNTITSGIGYTLNQTFSGTSLIINPSVAANGGGAVSCPFQVSDISEKTNGTLHLKVNVRCEAIKPNNRWPRGTSEESPNLVIDLGDNAKAGWLGFYLRIEVDQQGDILTAEDACTIQYTNNWVQGSSVIQVFYIAGVTISNDDAGGVYISNIENYCPVVAIKTAPTCPFFIEDYSLAQGVQPKISIRSTTVHRHYPTGMDAVNTYILNIPDTQQWYAVYAVIVTDEKGNFLFETNYFTLSLETEYKNSTQFLTYFLLGEVNIGYNDANPPIRVIDYIYNACELPAALGAIDSDGSIIPRGYSYQCSFRVTDASVETALKVQVAQGLIAGRWPNGMGLGYPPYILEISESCYIYCKLQYVPNDVILDSNNDAITFLQSNDLQENTVNEEYVLVATIVVTDTKITNITNVCAQIIPNPCNLKWGT